MDVTAPQLGRRERNKLDKLERITTAARELFAAHGIDEVTTQQIADRADIGTGTLFLYAKTKAELLLLVQNSAYADALVRGKADAERLSDPLEAVIAIVQPIVECNRIQVENGRSYLREIVYGDPTEPHHRTALQHTVETDQEIASVLMRDGRYSQGEARTLARVISAILFVTLSASANADRSVPALINDIREQVGVVLRP